MTDLVEFLLARIAEDERIASAAAGEALYDFWQPGIANPAKVSTETTWFPVAIAEHAPIGPHIARHDPRRVLAECEAKRRIIELHGQLVVMPLIGPSAGVKVTTDDCSNCSSYDEDVARDECPTLLLLALPYADHPDYRVEWAPAVGEYVG